MKNKILLLIFLFIPFVVFSQEMEAFWTLVFAGKSITAPVFANGNIYIAGADKALNCITTKGTFLWRRNTLAFPTPLLSTSSGGVVYLVNKENNIEAYSSQGVPIWTYKCLETPLFPVYIANDGYLIVTFKNKITCLTRQGKLKWELSLPESPIKEPLEVANKDLILILKDDSFLRISMFGKIQEQLSLKKVINSIRYAPEGYVIAFDDSSIFYYKIGVPSKLVWQIKEKNICKEMCYKDNSILCVFQNGDVSLKKSSDGSDIWNINLGINFNDEVKCTHLGNEVNIRAKGFACSITKKGKIKWKKKLQETEALPIITDNGLLIGIKKEILNAYRMETKLIKKNVKRIDPHKAKFSDSEMKARKEAFINKAASLYLAGFSTYEFFNEIESAINDGTVGEKEDDYLTMLIGIIQNDAKGAYFSHEFSSFERGRAAALLGQLGLYKYRDILLSQINITMDQDLSLGILQGLSYISYDPDERTIEGINFILNRFSPTNLEIVQGVVDAFLALVKFGDERVAKKAIESVFTIMNGSYPAVIREYVRQKVKDMI